jgi:predicted nucleotidyltransferase
MNPIFSKIRDHLKNKYNCHTIIIYGSFARGEESITSDCDLIGIRESGDFERDCEIFEGIYLDAFIYSEAMVSSPDVSLIRIKDGIVLCQKNDIGEELLKKIKDIFNTGPMKTPEWEKHEISTWLNKMLMRAKQSDIEGHFRRHWLLHDLLECYFKLRDQWYLGPKESFQWLRNQDLYTYDAFSKALIPDASLDSIKLLIERVIAA